MVILVSVGEGLPTYPLLMDEPLVGRRERLGINESQKSYLNLIKG